MSLSWKRYTALPIQAMAVAGANSRAQEVSNPRLQEALSQLRQAGVEQDAQTTRNELISILRSWYPPSLTQVLQLDPTLMSNDTYMQSYTKLAEYLKAHPEIIRDPNYFLGRPDDEYRSL